MELTCWNVRLKMRGPLLTTSSAPIGFGIDAPFARNEAGEYYMPGTLVKGRTKESWQELNEEADSSLDWERFFGKEPKEGEDWGSERGLLLFTDFIFREAASSKVDDDRIVYRIARDRQTRAVRSGQNLMIQSPFAAGADYWFEGRIWAVVGEAESDQLDLYLRQGLCWMPALGAETSVGFGVVADVEVKRVKEWRKGSGWEVTNSEDEWVIVLEPEGPLCLAGRRIADNMFESEPEISGGVIKGALADFILRCYGSRDRDVSSLIPSGKLRWKELCEEFHRIRMLHAKPVRKGVRRRPDSIPASAVQIDEKGTLKDVALQEGLIPVDKIAPAFQIDWKSSKEAEERFGICPVRRELRVRTQIETEERRAKEGNLFAYRMLVPRAKGGPGQFEEFEWLGGVSFADVASDKKQRVKTQLAEILCQYGIPGIGKLKTRCVVSRAQDVPAMKSVEKTKSHEWVVTLQTPALLCDVEQVGSGLSDAGPAYRMYWSEVSSGSLRLERWFARQKLAGGGFLWRKFQKGPSYRPLVLTQAGSTFVLHLAGDQKKAEECLDRWLKSGLPVAGKVCEKFGLAGNAQDWQRCPYVPENGFGEIAADLEWHWKEALG